MTCRTPAPNPTVVAVVATVCANNPKNDKYMTDEQIEKAALLAACDYDNPDDEPCYDKNFYDGFIAGANFALSHQWISVEERLPEDDQLVLAHFSDVNAEMCYATAYYTDGGWNTPDDWYYECKIDFWMPIPIPQLTPKRNNL